MIKRLFFVVLLISNITVASFIKSQDLRERTYYYEVLSPNHYAKPAVEGFASTRVKEKLNRGLVAAPTVDGNGVYLSWRFLETDGAHSAYHVYKKTKGKFIRLTEEPLLQTCDFIDQHLSNEPAVYDVRLVGEDNQIHQGNKITVYSDKLRNYQSIKLKKNTKAGKVAVADLNGDGYYDYIIRTPDSNVDPGSSGNKDGKTYQIEAYLHDGTWLWSKDLGLGIEPGIWYSPYIAYDFNGDGKAEIAIKTAPKNAVRNSEGRVDSGDEYLSIWDGMTGKELARVNWPERNERYGNLVRQNRNQLAMAFLDGKTPSILACRGTYKLMVVDAWQWDGRKMTKQWRWDGDEENPIIRSMGSHNIVCGDVDNDQKDEILLGSCMLDDNGTLLWSTGLGHSDKAYLTDIDPTRSGLEVFLCLEPWQKNGRGVCTVDAATGKQIWNINRDTYHVGDGMVTDIDTSLPGLECFASEDRKGGSTDRYLLSANGKYLQINGNIPGCRNWIWWDSDKVRETFQTTSNNASNIIKWKDKVLTQGIEGTIIMIADLYGDWREEVITSLPGEIRIYTTNISANDKRITLMQDAIYRSYICHRSMGYPQSPVPSYYLGE